MDKKDILKLISDETSLGDKIDILTDQVTQRVLNYINQSTLPTELEYIVKDIVIERYNKLGSEGMKSMSQEGLSMSFEEDFERYTSQLDIWLDKNSPQNARNRYILRY